LLYVSIKYKKLVPHLSMDIDMYDYFTTLAKVNVTPQSDNLMVNEM